MFSGVTAKFVLCFLLVILGILIGIKTAFDIRNDSIMKKQDLLFMTDQRLLTLVFEINNFPRGPGQDVLFLKNIDSLKKISEMGGGVQRGVNVANDLKAYLGQSKMFYSISYVDLKSGDAIYLSQRGGADFKRLEDLPPMTRKAIEVAESMPENKVYLSDAYESANNEKNVLMDYATPIYSEKSGEAVGVINLTVSINYLVEDIRSYSKPNEDVFLVNSDGYYLANSDARKEFKKGDSGKGYFLNDYPEVADTILTTDKRRIESKNTVFSIKHIYPTSSSFEFFNYKQDGSDYPYHWMLISALNKEPKSSRTADSYYFFIAAMIIIITSIVLIVKNKDVNKKIVLSLFLLGMLLPCAKANAMTVGVDIPEKYKSIEAGDRLYFELDIQYPENQSRKDVKIEYDLTKDGELIMQAKNLKAIESQASFMDYIVVPEFAKAGKYDMKVSVTDGVSGNGSDDFVVIERGGGLKVIFYTILALIGVLSLVIGWETMKLVKLEKK